MKSDEQTLAELEQAVADAPEDDQLRRQLIESLVKAQRFSDACEHVNALVQLMPTSTDALALGVFVAGEAGDHLLAARYRKQLRTYVDEIDDDEFNEFVMQSGHPSRDSENQAPFLRLLPGGASDSDGAALQRPTRTLDHIAGLATVKKNLIELIDETRTTEIPSRGEWIGGALFYGPPNCGKAFSVEVIAGELNASLWSFDLAEKWTAKQLRHLIGSAIESDDDRIAIFYFDNLDHFNADNLMESLTATLDTAREKARVAIFGAATFPWQASTRIVRPGRLGRVLLVLPPDGPSRSIFLTDRFNGRAKVTTEDIEWLVAHTDGHSFGDLERLVDVATAITIAGEESDSTPPTVSHEAIRKARQQVPSSSAEWLSKAGHHALMNESGGLYDDLLNYFRHRQRH